MSEPTCEKCGKPAVASVQDQKEAAPGKWEADGPAKHYCAEHARPQYLTFASGKCFRSNGEAPA